jgi:DNA polymerase-3 subunit beta
MLERVKFMPDGGQVSISVNDGATATIRSTGSRRYTLTGLPGSEFPSLPQPDPDARPLTLKVSDLEKLISATHFSISPDETRLHLNSALLEWERDVVRMVSTDGHRLSKAEVCLDGRWPPSSILIPLKGIQELRHLCGKVMGAKVAEADAPTVDIIRSGPNAFFRLGGALFSVKLVDAMFPPYNQVIPASSDRLVRAPRLALYDALKAVSVSASDRTGAVKMTLNSGKVRVESESPDSGQAFDEVAVDYDGAELSIGFNARYFLDVLGVIESDEVTIGLSGELDPAVVKPAAGDAGQLFVIMPMRV